MQDIAKLDICYNSFVNCINKLSTESVYNINLQILHTFNLLHFYPDQTQKNSIFTEQFHVSETPEKITLFNHQFIVWIAPAKHGETPMTIALIALNHEEKEPMLEAAIFASGIYNTSKIVLRFLEKILSDIKETENYLERIQRPLA